MIVIGCKKIYNNITMWDWISNIFSCVGYNRKRQKMNNIKSHFDDSYTTKFLDKNETEFYNKIIDC